GMEAVAVLHQELAQANQAATRARLVAELGLYLKDQLRQLAVRRDNRARQIGDGLLMGHRQHHRAPSGIREARQLAADGVVASALAPEFGWLHDRQQQLLPADALHLLTEDGLDAADS